MCDFKIKHISDFPGYDHSGTKDFIDDIAAQKRKDALFQECGDNVLKIDIYDAA